MAEALFSGAVHLQDVAGAKQADGNYQELQHLGGADSVHQLGDHCQERDGEPGELEESGNGLHGPHSTREAAKWQR